MKRCDVGERENINQWSKAKMVPAMISLNLLAQYGWETKQQYLFYWPLPLSQPTYCRWYRILRPLKEITFTLAGPNIECIFSREIICVEMFILFTWDTSYDFFQESRIAYGSWTCYVSFSNSVQARNCSATRWIKNATFNYLLFRFMTREQD